MPTFWRPQFRIGHDDIDADHRYLIEVWSRNMRSYVLIVNSEEAED